MEKSTPLKIKDSKKSNEKGKNKKKSQGKKPTKVIAFASMSAEEPAPAGHPIIGRSRSETKKSFAIQEPKKIPTQSKSFSLFQSSSLRSPFSNRSVPVDRSFAISSPNSMKRDVEARTPPPRDIPLLFHNPSFPHDAITSSVSLRDGSKLGIGRGL
jgi:hypothetical protein